MIWKRVVRHSKTLIFLGIHVLAIVGLFYTTFSWKWIALCLGMYYLRMFFVTAGYHRYFSHRTFKTSRLGQFILAFMAQTSLQKGVLWWAGNHRHHHTYSDQPEDIHSPKQRGFWWAHIGWIISEKYVKTKTALIEDLHKYRELRWLNKFHAIPFLAFCAVLYLVGGWFAVYWGGLLSTVLLWHSTYTINSLSHVWGWRAYKTSDTSKNNVFLALLTMGEGWHNNHHRYPIAARQGFKWYEIDFTYYGLKMLSWLGFVWDIRKVPRQIIEARFAPAD